MWQVLLAAAVAGSTGLVAKHFFNPFSLSTQRRSLSTERRNNHFDEQEISSETEEPVTPVRKSRFLESGYESNYDKNDGIFRFSSSGSAGKSCSRGSRVKCRVRARGLKKKGFGGDEIEKRSGGGMEVSRRVSVCLKKRRTIKHGVSKCGSCSNKDSSLFSWGLGVGIMYIMSAGKSEISKLNTAMDETAKVVQELQDELYRRKSLRNAQVPVSSYGVATNLERIEEKDSQLALSKSGIGSGGSNVIKLHGFPLSGDGEYASSVLTEEPEPEMVEIDRLEIELESELQKLNLTEPEDDHMKGFNGPVDVSESYQCGGILPSLLDNKLCHLLIGQQENQIEELESELQTVQSKLQQKEAELQALKDCVRRLTEFSLSNPSGDEMEPKQDPGFTDSWSQPNHTDTETIKPMVGMKRPIDL